MSGYFVIKLNSLWVTGPATSSSEMHQARVFADGQKIDGPFNPAVDRYDKLRLDDWIAAIKRRRDELESEASMITRRLESVKREFR